MLHATVTGRFDQLGGLVATMADLQERSHSSFWAFIRSNQEAMHAFYRGDLETSERLAEHCLQLADELPEEDGAGTYGLRMFMIRREQDRLAAMGPLVRRVLASADSGTRVDPGSCVAPDRDRVEYEAAAEALAPARAGRVRPARSMRCGAP